jgi:hypothetical protein
LCRRKVRQQCSIADGSKDMDQRSHNIS